MDFGEQRNNDFVEENIMLTLRNLREAGIEIEGYKKVQCWEDEDNPTIYYEGYKLYDMNEKYLDRNVRYISHSILE